MANSRDLKPATFRYKPQIQCSQIKVVRIEDFDVTAFFCGNRLRWMYYSVLFDLSRNYSNTGYPIPNHKLDSQNDDDPQYMWDTPVVQDHNTAPLCLFTLIACELAHLIDNTIPDPA